MVSGRFKQLLDKLIGKLAVGLLGAIKHMDRKRSADFAGSFMRKFGPLLKEHRIGRENLRAAFPEKSDVEIEKILAGVWDNLGRVAVEFAHLDEFHVVEAAAPTTPDDLPFPPQSRARYQHITQNGKAMIGFAAHLANWELFAVTAKQIGANTAILYRRPNIRAISDLVVKLRTPLMGQLIPTSLDAPLRLGRLLHSPECTSACWLISITPRASR